MNSTHHNITCLPGPGLTKNKNTNRKDEHFGLSPLPQTIELVWRADEDMVHDQRSDLGPLVRQLAQGECLEIHYRFRPRQDGGNKIFLRTAPTGSGSRGNRPASESHARSDFFSGVSAACPSFVPLAVETQDDQLCAEPPVALQPSGRPIYLDDTVSDVMIRRPGPRDAMAETLILPQRGLPHLDIKAALRGLAVAASCFDLTVRLQAVNLSVDDRLAISRGMRHLRPVFPEMYEDPARTQQALTDLSFLTAWAGRGHGWHITCCLSLETASPGLVATIADLLHGAPSCAEVAGLHDGVCDLSLACPAGPPLPNLIPALRTLNQLGFIGAARLAPAPRPSGPRLQLGHTSDGQLFDVARSDLGRHMLILGSTGVGKSTLIRQMIRQDIEAGVATIVIDPHGDLFQDILDSLDPEARDKTVIADVSGRNGTFGIDLFNVPGKDRAIQANFVANQLISVFQRVLYRDQPEGFGPMFSAYFRNAVLLLMLADSQDNREQKPDFTTGSATLLDFDRLFHDVKFRNACLAACPDDAVIHFWKGIALKAGGEASLENIAPYIVSKLTQFTGNPLIRPILSHSNGAIDFSDVLDNGKPLLVNLAKGSAGETDAALIGALITIQLFGTLLQRCSRPRQDRPTVRIYLDEFQTYASDTLGQMLAESRKTGAQLVLASQDLTSFGGSTFRGNVAGAILSNVGHLLSFRVGPRDAALLSDWFSPTFEPRDLTRLPDQVYAARTLDGGVPRRPCLVKTMTEEGLE